MSTLLGQTTPDPIALMLGTGYSRFESSCGMNGLFKQSGTILEILALDASGQGKGQFREFIRRAKEEYTTIYVWEVWNPIVQEALERYGFLPAVDVGPDGVPITGMRWNKEVK